MTTPAADDLRDTQHKIVDAAFRCFERYGPQRTSMSDIAEEAGISRRTLYRVFDDRSSLIEEILRRRFIALGETVQARLKAYDDIEEALVDGALFSIELAERDELFSQIVTHEYNRSLERFLLRGNNAQRAGLRDLWAPVLERGRAAQRIPHDLTDDRVMELFSAVSVIVLMRDDLSRQQRRDLISDLLVPAILRTTTMPS